jgi:DNA-binding CsgD family transcriptional regulator
MKGDPGDVLSLIERIYDAAVDPERWPAFLGALAAGYPGGQGLLYRVRGSEAYMMAAGWERSWTDAYNAHYGAVNPWLPGIRARPVGMTTAAEQFLRPSDLKRTEWYHDFLKPQRLETGVGATVVSEPGRVVAVSVLCTRQNGEGAGPAHVARLAACVPHLLRAIEVNRALAYTALERRAAGEALERLGIGVIIATKESRVLFMNSVADCILASQDGLVVRSGGVLAAAQTAANTALRRAIREAALTSVGLGQGSGAARAVARPSGQRAYEVLVAPLRGVPEMLGLAPRSALVLISDPELRQHLPETILQELHDLTPTQAKIAAALARGESPEEIADALHTAVSTVRQHVKAVLAKTDTHRQSELVHLILASIAPLAAAPEPAGGATTQLEHFHFR